VLLPTGTGQPKTIERGGIEEYSWATWFPDANAFSLRAERAGPGHAMLCAGNQRRREATPCDSRKGWVGTQVSPDGKFVIATNANDQTSLYPIDGEIHVLSPDSQKERESYAGALMATVFTCGVRKNLPIRVYRLDPISGHKEMVKELTPADAAGLISAPKILLTPDGKWLCHAMRRNLTTLFLANGLR